MVYRLRGRRGNRDQYFIDSETNIGPKIIESEAERSTMNLVWGLRI